MTMVINDYGTEIDYEAAEVMMDEELVARSGRAAEGDHHGDPEL